MTYENVSAAIAQRAVYGCSDEVQLHGPWNWRFAIQNGTRLPIKAKFHEEFLHLACNPGVNHTSLDLLERALLANNKLTGGAKISLANPSGTISLSADFAVLNDKQISDRLRAAIEGFHDGVCLLQSSGFQTEPAGERPCVGGPDLEELLQVSSWPTTHSGPNEFCVELNTETGATAQIQQTKNSVVAGVEFVHMAQISEISRQALAVYLLTASSALRFVRAYAIESADRWSYGMQVGLAAVPEISEIDHALSALAVAYRTCARESNVHLCEAAASCYLAARNLSTKSDTQLEKEN